MYKPRDVYTSLTSPKITFANRIPKIFIDLKRGGGGAGRGGVMVCRAVNIEAKDVSIIFIEFCKYAYILTHPK